MICLFGCDCEEARAFQNALKGSGLDIRTEQAELCHKNAALIPPNAVVSVSHRANVDAEIIRALRDRGVDYVNTRSIGLNHIDLAAANALNITVEGIAYSPESIAEHAVLLMLMVSRNIAPVWARGTHGDYRLPDRRADALCAMTVGVVGTGRIGRCVINILRGFGCHLIGYDPAPAAAIAYRSLDALLAQSDLVTLHLPLTSETRHILNRTRIRAMKRGAMLVNVSRGALVDTQALADALEEGRLAGAGLDVVEQEEGWFYRERADVDRAPFSRLRENARVVITPHCAFYTRTALEDIVENTLKNCKKHERMLEKWIV